MNRLLHPMSRKDALYAKIKGTQLDRVYYWLRIGRHEHEQTPPTPEEEFAAWQARGKTGSAPHLVKQDAVRSYGARFGLKTLVETGTFRGDMVYAMRADFDRIYSIELNGNLAKAAQAPFCR